MKNKVAYNCKIKKQYWSFIVTQLLVFHAFRRRRNLSFQLNLRCHFYLFILPFSYKLLFLTKKNPNKKHVVTFSLHSSTITAWAPLSANHIDWNCHELSWISGWCDSIDDVISYNMWLCIHCHTVVGMEVWMVEGSVFIEQGSSPTHLPLFLAQNNQIIDYFTTFTTVSIYH